MSLRRADARFTLPGPVRRAAVLGGLDDWADGLRQGGVELVDDGAHADLVVAPAELAAAAASLRAPMLLLERTRHSPAGAYAAYPVVALPGPHAPELLLVAGQSRSVRYALEHWRPGATRAQRLRNVIARTGLAHGLPLPGRPPTLVAAREPGPPLAVTRAAETAGIRDPQWFASIGLFADPFSRAAFYVFERDAKEPGWVVKFSRVPGLDSLFDLDEAGLRLAAQTGGPVAAVAPRLLGRFELGGGLHAAAETAAVGVRLGAVLSSRAPRAERLAAVERLADWLVTVARDTAAPAPALDATLARLGREVVPEWVHAGLSADMLDGLPPLGSVFVHGDLHGENVFVAKTRFTVLDWESAQANGPPVWDLLYFLADTLATLDGAMSADDRAEHFVQLFRGDIPASEVLFRRTREVAAASALPVGAVGPLATLLWLELALLETKHVERVDRVVEQAGGAAAPMRRRAERWLREPGLGPGWRAWQS